MSLDALLIEAARSGDALHNFMNTHQGESVFLTAVCGGAAAPAPSCSGAVANGPLSQAIADARSKVSKALHQHAGGDHHDANHDHGHHGHHGHRGHGHHGHHKGEDLHAEVASLRRENDEMREQLAALQKAVSELQVQIKGGEVEKHVSFKRAVPESPQKEAPKKPANDDDDDFELFGSDEDEEDEEAACVREERLQAYAAKKSKKPGVIAKSSVVLDVKPWDDETNMKEVEDSVRTIQMDGLIWGASKLVPLAYGIKKLQVMCVVEDEKVSVDELTEKIEEFEELVQSVDIASFNKI